MNRLKNRTLIKTYPDGTTQEVGLRFVPHDYIYGFKYIVTDDESELLVGMVENERAYLIADEVEITGDIMGYICPGILHPGKGTIIEIRKHDTDHFYGVLMDNGEFGFMKSARITVS